MGDFNADRYDHHVEDFWVNYDPDGFQFKTMSPEHGDEYPPTRMAGVPLFSRSRIGKYAWLEDASWTLGVDHKWYLSKPP